MIKSETVVIKDLVDEDLTKLSKNFIFGDLYYKIDKALELFKKKKDKFDLKDASKIISDANRLFHRDILE